MPINFGHAHPRQIKNMLNWLNKARDDLDDEIRSLERQLASVEEEKNQNQDFEKLMQLLISENVTHEEAEKRLFEMGYQADRVKEAHRLLRLSAKAQRRRMRNDELVRRVLVNKEPISSLSNEYGISRQTIYRVLDGFDVLGREQFYREKRLYPNAPPDFIPPGVNLPVTASPVHSEQ